MRDDNANFLRLTAYGVPRFMFMKSRLISRLGRHYNLKVIQQLATATAREFNTKIDRCSRRKFDMLILWVFERWETIGEFFDQSIDKYLEQQARESQKEVNDPFDMFVNENEEFNNIIWSLS